MATRKQVAANRRNAQRSTGPKTPEGKAAVRLNALKHGLCAEDAVVFGEDEEAFDDLRDSFLDHLQPVGPLEAALVRQIVTAQWRLARCRKLETGFFELGLIDHKEDLELDYNGLTNKDKLAHVFRRDACPTPSVLGTLSRYEVRIERAFFRALHELQGLQAARQHTDPPPPAETNFAEQSHSAPDTQPNPVPQNDLAPAVNLPVAQALPPVGQAVPPAQDFLPPLAAHRPDPCLPGACC